MAIVPKYTSLDAAFCWWDKKAGLEDGSTQKLNELYKADPQQAIEVLTSVLNPRREKSQFAWAALGMISKVVYGITRKGKKDGTLKVYPSTHRFHKFLGNYDRKTRTEMVDDIACQVIPQLVEKMPPKSTYRRKLEKLVDSEGSLTQAIALLKKTQSLTTGSFLPFYANYGQAVLPIVTRQLPSFGDAPHKALMEFLDYQESGYINPNGIFAKSLNYKRSAHRRGSGSTLKGSARIQIS